MLEHTQECLGIHGDAYELLGIPRNAQDHMWKPSGQLGHLQFWLPQGNDQPSLGIAKTHLESFGRL